MYSNVKHNIYICCLNFHSNNSGINHKYFTNHFSSLSSTTEPQGRKFLLKQRGGGGGYKMLVSSVYIIDYDPAGFTVYPPPTSPQHDRGGIIFCMGVVTTMQDIFGIV